jgi:CRISPR/Cas system CSM-associated protein Csm3 (group 7 of RAMP superfamily)
MSNTMAGLEVYSRRVVLTLQFTLKSALHVGSGFEEAIERRDGEPYDASTCVLDATGMPYIPSTTLKGAVRQLVSAVEGGEGLARAKVLFGDIRSDKAGVVGCAIFSGARLLEVGGIDARIERKKKHNDKAYAFLARRTAIDDASGTADNGKLFAQWLVPQGSRFECRLTLSGAALVEHGDDSRAILSLLLSLMEDGIAVGRGKADGQGLLQLTSIAAAASIRIVDGRIERLDNRQNEWLARVRDSKKLKRWHKRYALRLSGSEAFQIAVPDDAVTTKQRAKGDRNTLRAMRHHNGMPHLSGTSLMGVLRSKAEWFERLQAKRDKRDPDFAKIQDLFGWDADQVKNKRRDGEEQTGFAALLRVEAIKEKAAPLEKTASVKLDRFTMGPFNTGLFETEAFAKPFIDVDLVLDERARARLDLITFCDSFFASIASASNPARGLALGHGGNRGYGWFDVTLLQGAVP